MQIKLKCAIYTRVSTDNQAEVEFNSCEAQEAKIRSFVNSQEDMEIYKSYVDAGFTGANMNRPGLTDMLNDIRENKINLVIAYKIDRLTRSPRDFYQLIELFEKYGVNFISVTERFDTSTPSGRLLRNIMLTFAQFERELTSERTKDKLYERAQKGLWNGGLVPFGYKKENKKLIINEAEARIVKSIYESYLECRSISKIYDDLKNKGITYRTGIPFSKSSIQNMLRYVVYTGKVKHGDKVFKGIQEPIISEEMFNAVQEIHKKKKLKAKLYKDYPLAGLLKCRECDSFMTPCHTNKYKDGKRTRYYYYRCTKTFKRDWESCGTRQVSADRLEDYVFQNLERISQDKQYIDSLIFKLNSPQAGNRIGFPSTSSGQAHDGLNATNKSELSSGCAGLELPGEPPKVSPEIFGQTLTLFVKGLRSSSTGSLRRKGLEKSLWAKKFIQGISY
ncbi:MAG: recombinase family protein, partial [Elusimicrobia bacterium]|nr:recombinase family protein [Elusimicrobiota bacterium]